MIELANFLTKALVEHPDDVEVTSSRDGDEIKLTIKVADSDKGKIIGKRGKVIKAIRTVLFASAAKDDKRVSIEIG